MRICLITTEYFSHGIFGGIGAIARQQAIVPLGMLALGLIHGRAV